MPLNKYDPRLKKYDELTKTFACGENIFREILEDLKPSKSQKLTRQSWIITGPRGAGKSHLITLLFREINQNKELGKHWTPLIFPEEIFQVDSLYRLLIVILENLFKNMKGEKGIEELNNKFSEIKKVRIKGGPKEKKVEKQRLAKELLELLLLTREQGKKKFIFLLENLQTLFREQLSEDDQKLLRGFLHENPDCFIIMGTALAVFQDIEHYGKPFYHFFRVRSMEALERKGIIHFLQKVSAFRGDANINEKIESNRHYIYTYNIFTGGNPRLILFLYELLLDNDQLSTEIILEKVSELTPYFLDKTREESSQRKLILDALALGAPAQTATEIAEYINEEQKSITEQLKRLAAEGWIKVIPLRAEGVKQKEVFFTLRDYFYRIWYQVRMGDIDESEVYCLAELAALLFSREEIEERLQRHRSMGSNQVTVYERASELAGDEGYMANIKLLIKSSREAEDEEIKKIYKDIEKSEQKGNGKKILQLAEELKCYPDEKAMAYFCKGIAYGLMDNFNKQIDFYRKGVEITPASGAWHNMGISYSAIKDYKNAYSSYSEYLKLAPTFHLIAFSAFGRYIQIAENCFQSSQELNVLLDEKASLEIRLESLVRLILLGKHLAVTDTFYELLKAKELPLLALKKLDFFLQGTIFHLFNKGKADGEVTALLESWVRLIARMFEGEHEKSMRKFLEFFRFALGIAGKEKVSLEVIHGLMEDLRDKGIEISDVILKVLSAVKEPNSRDSQKWMADPLFKEIVTMLG